ncbi:hypothetical protein KIPB_000207 [Kipferlia bialata]|uniref:PDEase domain-containing protein n=1 Tax=Kipferlia bialata TaxID=797122 RepID=A0A9K3CQ56_9EUKA|nr:hypothetical protein KIPB_000207 [Kipferlia bialata]|eukprot:g207.t1
MLRTLYRSARQLSGTRWNDGSRGAPALASTGGGYDMELLDMVQYLDRLVITEISGPAQRVRIRQWQSSRLQVPNVEDHPLTPVPVSSIGTVVLYGLRLLATLSGDRCPSIRGVLLERCALLISGTDAVPEYLMATVAGDSAPGHSSSDTLHLGPSLADELLAVLHNLSQYPSLAGIQMRLEVLMGSIVSRELYERSSHISHTLIIDHPLQLGEDGVWIDTRGRGKTASAVATTTDDDLSTRVESDPPLRFSPFSEDKEVLDEDSFRDGAVDWHSMTTAWGEKWDYRGHGPDVTTNKSLPQIAVSQSVLEPSDSNEDVFTPTPGLGITPHMQLTEEADSPFGTETQRVSLFRSCGSLLSSRVTYTPSPQQVRESKRSAVVALGQRRLVMMAARATRTRPTQQSEIRKMCRTYEFHTPQVVRGSWMINPITKDARVKMTWRHPVTEPMQGTNDPTNAWFKRILPSDIPLVESAITAGMMGERRYNIEFRFLMTATEDPLVSIREPSVPKIQSEESVPFVVFLCGSGSVLRYDTDSRPTLFVGYNEFQRVSDPGSQESGRYRERTEKPRPVYQNEVSATRTESVRNRFSGLLAPLSSYVRHQSPMLLCRTPLNIFDAMRLRPSSKTLPHYDHPVMPPRVMCLKRGDPTCHQCSGVLLRRFNSMYACRDMQELLQDSVRGVRFDAECFDAKMGGFGAGYLFLYVILTNKLPERLGLNTRDWMAFLFSVHQNTHKAPFTNTVHTLDALQMAIALTNYTGPVQMSPVLRLLLLVAVYCRNLDRPGLSQDYIVDTNHCLSVVHGRKMPFEKQACAVAIKLMRHHGILRSLPTGSEDFICRTIIATHKDNVQSLSFLAIRATLPPRDPSESQKTCPVALVSPDSALGQFQTLVVQCLAVTSLMGNTARPWEVAKRFGHARMKQGFGSGLLEAAAGCIVPYRRNMMAGSPSVTAQVCQAAYIRDTVGPYLAAIHQMASILPKSVTLRDGRLVLMIHALLQQAAQNYRHWESE